MAPEMAFIVIKLQCFTYCKRAQAGVRYALKQPLSQQKSER